MMWHDGYGFWPGGGLLALAFLILIVVGIALTVSYLTRTSRHIPPPTAPPADPAVQILRERFARGEITQAEFDERRRTLGG